MKGHFTLLSNKGYFYLEVRDPQEYCSAQQHKHTQLEA